MVEVRVPTGTPLMSSRVHVLMLTCTLEDMKASSVVIHRPGYPSVRIGPFIAPSNARRLADALRELMPKRTHIAGSTVAVEDFDADFEHEDPRLPTEPWLLAELIEAELIEAEEPVSDEDVDGAAFPDLHARLCAQVGRDRADAIWDKATGWSGPATHGSDADERVDQLLTSAEEWRAQRDGATAALQSIGVQLWRHGMQNVRQIANITGLSRGAVYDGLRAGGIEPKDRWS